MVPRRHAIRLTLLLFVLLLLLANYYSSAATVDDKGSLARSFVKLRTGLGSQGSVWYHTGCIRNPLTGSEVVSIQGIETVKPLSNCSYLSSKVFIYTDRHNSTVPIDTFRVRRQAPRRPVDPVKVVNEIVTIGAAQQRFFTQVEFASGRQLYSRKVDLYDGRRGGLGRGDVAARGLKLVHHMNGVSARRGQPSAVDAVSPKRGWRRWVSFAGSDSEGHGKAQEYYHIWESSWPLLTAGSRAAVVPEAASWRQRVAQSMPRLGRGAAMQCMRHGECPPWYALGRQCTTELSATRLASLGAVPGPVLELVRARCPDYLPVAAQLLARSAQEGVSLFRTQTDHLDEDKFRPWYSPRRWKR